jgi:hypothetical protein
MAIIKSKLRNCLHIPTVDAHMMVASNGPPISDHAAVNKIVDTAIDHWEKLVKRNANRSHVGTARPKKKKNTMKLSDLLLGQARDARRLTDDGPPLCEEDEEPDNPEVRRAEQGLLEEDVDLKAQLQLAIGPFMIPDGFQQVPKPSCASQMAWALMCKGSFWRGKRIAHIAADGWHAGTFRRKYVGTGATPDEGWVFYCRDTRLQYIHRLLIDDYGLTLAWIIIEKASGDGDDYDEETYARQYTRGAHGPRTTRA